MAAVELSGRDMASPDRSMQNWNYATQSLCIGGMTMFFALRVYTRMFILNGFTKEDWICFGAWFLGVSYSVVALIMSHFGGGVHWNDVPEAHHIPFQKTVYVTMVLYGPTAYLTKLSLLWIMTRVFSPFRKSVIFIYFFLALMLAYYIPAVIVKIRICDPIAKFWVPDLPGSCLDQSSIILADAVVSVVSDFIVLLVPLPLTVRLQLPLKKKMRVMVILGAGGLACASSIIRLILILLTGQSKDATIAFMRVNMFGNAEIAIGVICACLPAMSALAHKAKAEYSSRRATQSSTYQLSKFKNPSSRTDRSRTRMSSIMDMDHSSDHYILMPEEPKMRSAVRGDGERERQGLAQGITKTVDVDVVSSVGTR
ncbi:hypothetical protein P168DRAFT_311363 [Aspergillus campestris IBT 28561]|uniref:Rhodopsin domain-containing protein n=1 Tax=Aspergillus campestris (strain IBT 28561) TaxID=1392248 RepID=A0A2I1D1S0_ASPC2|nr:uncharacterized protein P168DRAFT_311363 [Aspergillus campestris IBT 28561]PKY03825.1 hypothetical protein P168DRAFT_311363 [Aspergillus campestris IBT 28561]